MVSREDVIESLGRQEQGWVARCQMIAVFVFLALFAALVLWSVVASPWPSWEPAQPTVKAGAKPTDGNAKDETEAP
jgi:hypothetical protein